MKIFLILYLIFFFSLSGGLFAQSKKKKIIYEYKKYEKFDFGDLSIEASKNALGDLSVNSRYQVKFKNELPKKPNFNREMIDSVDNLL